MQTINGRIVKFLPKQEGDSQRGHWVKAGLVIEYGDEYPKKAAFSLFGEDRLQMCKGLKEGTLVQVSYNPESREYQDRWYTELNCIRLQAVGASQPASAPVSAPTPAPARASAPTPASTMQAEDPNGDLPF